MRFYFIFIRSLVNGRNTFAEDAEDAEGQHEMAETHSRKKRNDGTEWHHGMAEMLDGTTENAQKTHMEQQ